MTPPHEIFSMFLLTSVALAQLAPLEPSQKGVYFGPWYERLNGDTPLAIQQRTQVKSFSLWQSDMNITDTLQSAYIDDFVKQVDALRSDAVLYLTIYPIMGFEAVTQAAINEFATKIQTITASGRRVLIRYASEMNGSWFLYGQQPTAFLANWKQVVDAVRAKVPDRSKYAFLWAPNAANGWPFGGALTSLTPARPNYAVDFPLMDTNADGVLDALDDPYSPFYPGDDYVDWVGFSMYHYGAQYPWVTNDVPIPGKPEAILVGKPGWGAYNFYEMFCGSGAGGQPVSKSKGGKPFMITETGSTIHLSVDGPNATDAPTRPLNADAESRVPIKQTWWRQMLNETFLNQFPKIKGISTFEFIKHEETSWRDFTNMGKGTNITSQFGGDGGDMDNLVLKAFQDDFNGPLAKFVIWSNATTGSNNGNNGNNPTNSAQSKFAFLAFMILALIQ
ncbi:glycoside hydrolase superfamily [Gorgonomyces haynaldii]|nr:glycoside hydrolase superfamily [Gorgonomyces haynaldii]